MARSLRRLGAILLEQVVSIGLLGLVLLLVAAMTAQTGRGGRTGRARYDANCVVQSTLEHYQAVSPSLLPLGPLPDISGQLSDGTPYLIELETYSLGGSGIATGLSDDDLRGLRVRLSWGDNSGSHQALAEGLLTRIPR